MTSSDAAPRQQASASGHASVLQAGGDIIQILADLGLENRPGLHSTVPPVGGLPAVIRGRGRLIGELSALLDQPGAPVQVLHGLGGCGKTTVALEVARSALDRMPVWWVSAANADTLSTGMRQVAASLGADIDQLRLAWSGHASAPDLVWRLLEEQVGHWLLVIDGADDTGLLTPPGGRVGDGSGWIRRARSGTVLVTRRSGNPTLWGPWAALRHVRQLSARQGGQVLRDIVRVKAGARADAEALARDLHGLPLALRLAGAYLQRAVSEPPWPGTAPIRSFADYRLALGRDRLALLDRTPPGRYEERTPRELITRTWEISLDLLAAQGRGRTRPLLRLLAHLAEAPVPYLLLLNPDVMSHRPVIGATDYAELSRALNSLAELSLIELSTVAASDRERPLMYTLTLHPLVRETNRSHPEAAAQRREYVAAVTALIRHASAGLDPDEPVTWSSWQLIAPHAAGLVSFLGLGTDIDRAVTQEAADAAKQSADYLEAVGMYVTAEAEYRAVLDAQVRLLGGDHPDTLGTRHNLAYVLRGRGLFDDAAAEYEAVLAGRIRSLGATHPGTLRTRNQLARVRRDQRRYAEAAAEFDAVLRAQRQTLGEEHRDTLITRSNLASIRYVQQRYAEAEAEYRAVLAAERRLLGEENVETLVTHGNLAKVIAVRGQLDRAEIEYRAVLAAEERILGTEHPDTLTTRHNLAGVLAALGRFAEARETFREVLATRRRRLGDGHPDTRDTERALAALPN